MLGMPWIPHSHPLFRDGSICVMADRDICLAHSSVKSFGKYKPGMIQSVLSSYAYQKAVAPDQKRCPSCEYSKHCKKCDLLRPFDGCKDIYTGTPYCKSVLESVAP
jgi:hypothetical protein